jgi:putative transposase
MDYVLSWNFKYRANAFVREKLTEINSFYNKRLSSLEELKKIPSQKGFFRGIVMLYKNKYRIESTRQQNWDYSSNGWYYVTICTHDRIHYFGTIQNGKMSLSDMGVIAQQYWREIPNHFPMVRLDEWVIMPNHVHGIIVIDDTAISGPNGIRANAQGGALRGDFVSRGLHDPHISETSGISRGSHGSCSPARSRSCPCSRSRSRSRRDKALPCLYHHHHHHHADADAETGTNADTPTNTNFNDNNNGNDMNNNQTIPKTPKSRFQNQGKGTISAIIGSYKSVCTKTINTSHKKNQFAWQPRFYDHIIRDEMELNRIRAYILNNPGNWNMDDFYSKL